MAGFLTCNSAHARCVAQYFLGKLVTDLKTAKASSTTASGSYNPEAAMLDGLWQGFQPVVDFIHKNKDVVKVTGKYDVEFKRMT